jgi:acyl-CoA reductase-like NAD-dependent aldehyde dehydrogenase
MKISDIPADRAFDVLADVAGPLSNIVSDSGAMSSISATSATDAVRAVGEIARTHKDDLNAILAAVAGKSVEDYLAGTNALEVINDAVELLTDESIFDFLPSPQTEPSKSA